MRDTRAAGMVNKSELSECINRAWQGLKQREGIKLIKKMQHCRLTVQIKKQFECIYNIQPQHEYDTDVM